MLNDESKVDKEGIDNIEGVKGQFAVAGQYQIIFGSGTVNKVHAELTKLLGIGDVSKAEVAEAASGNQNLLQRLVKGLADIFVPIIPAIVAGGLLMGIHSMLTAKGFFVDELSVIDMHPGLADLVDFINTIANAPLYSYRYYLVSLPPVNSAVTHLRGSAWDVVGSPCISRRLELRINPCSRQNPILECIRS